MVKYPYWSHPFYTGSPQQSHNSQSIDKKHQKWYNKSVQIRRKAYSRCNLRIAEYCIFQEIILLNESREKLVLL